MERHWQIGLGISDQERSLMRESFEKIDKDVRAKRDLGKGNRPG